jgi:2-polyprenyl-3-methyl-5-hydroxy-6-metoxy-1,4-benzoquinol methylase
LRSDDGLTGRVVAAIFSGLWGRVLRQAWTLEQTQADAEFIEQLLHVSPPASILDVPCGEGRIARVLASRGYAVTGVDGTASFLDNARRAANEQHLAIHWEQRDMRELVNVSSIPRDTFVFAWVRDEDMKL